MKTKWMSTLKLFQIELFVTVTSGVRNKACLSTMVFVIYGNKLLEHIYVIAALSISIKYSAVHFP